MTGDTPEDDAAILRRFGIEPDPVIEYYKKDVDRALLRENLRRTPEERFEHSMAIQRLAEELRRSGRDASSRAEFEALLAEGERLKTAP